MDNPEQRFPKIFDFDDRLIRFAGESILFSRKLDKTFENDYNKNQLIHFSGSASLNYGEAQGTITDKDFVFKISLSVKGLKESRNSLKSLIIIKLGVNKRELIY
ncbi:four helix bundle protein [Flavobacterium faecale]|uniref:four helix bundle protein n=1 Tax=Flavobacterium faecale TaxID=1355330 RepID=UPI003AAD07ED